MFPVGKDGHRQAVVVRVILFGGLLNMLQDIPQFAVLVHGHRESQ